MNSLCKQYISQVKSFFPILGREERQYLNTLSANLDDFCENETVETMEDLYKYFGTPADTINDYYSSYDTNHLIKRIRVSKWIKRSLIFLGVVIMCCALVWNIMAYETYKTFKEEQIYFTETTIQ